ncbi:MAG: hypothetical protein ACOX30_05625 [Dethiobacteria bacterium]|jgi:tetratricopeptide (TPR) repeat protein
MVRVSDVQFANETHQLLVSISRNLYITGDGVLKYQEKRMDVDTTNYHRSKREHLVYYALNDLFSGNFIFAVATTKKMLPLLDFLHYAWKKDKEEAHFWGLPLKLSVPRRLSFPALLDGLQKLGVEPFHPSSGFTSGIHIIKSLEDNLCYFILGRSSLHSFDAVQQYKNLIYEYILKGHERENRAVSWRNNLPPGGLRKVPGYDRFKEFFPLSEKENSALPLHNPGAADSSIKIEPHRFDFLGSPLEHIKFSQEKLDQAEELLYAAYDAQYRDLKLHRAYKALRCSPYCADAYNLLAGESNYLDEKLALYRRAVRAGELSLGELFFKRNEGHFWGVIESRPYMRALDGLADTLWKQGSHEETLEIYQKMLRLNHNDNQGIRYLLGFRLLDEKRYGEVEKLFRDHGEESCFMLYSLALSRFCSGISDADGVLRRALQANKHVPAYLLGEEEVPYHQPDSYSHGNKEEAVIYVAETAAAWREANGALEWLQRIVSGSAGEKANPGKADPCISRVLQDFLAKQAARLGKQTLDKYEMAIEMLETCLDSYGHQHLGDVDKRALDRYLETDGDEKASFCRFFGPAKIPDIIVEFLGYFMVRKVICDRDQLRTTGTALKRLAGWLAGEGYIKPDVAEDMIATATQGSRELPDADELSDALYDFVNSSPPVEGDEEIEDLFEVVKVEPGRLYLQAGSEEPVAVDVPRRISELCRVGWMFYLLLVKTKKGWHIIETSRAYPQL